MRGAWLTYARVKCKPEWLVQLGECDVMYERDVMYGGSVTYAAGDTLSSMSKKDIYGETLGSGQSATA